MPEVSYNGYDFPSYAQVEVAIEMVYDDAQRTVTFNRYQFDVQAIIVAEAGDTYCGGNFQAASPKADKARAGASRCTAWLLSHTLCRKLGLWWRPGRENGPKAKGD